MPLEIYKVLGQVKSTGSPQNLYTVPANALAQVYVIVSSSDSSTQKFSVSVSKNGAATSNGDTVYDQISLDKNTAFTTSTFTLAAGDIIRVDTDGSTNFTFQAHGVEIYTPSQGVYFTVYENGVASTVRLYNIEKNLNYLSYMEDDTLLRIGFNGYGLENELVVDFPSTIDREVFIAAFEQARVYGSYDGVDPVTHIINLGNNITIGGTTTTSTTTTTTAGPTTTTTTAGPTTTTTSTTSTTTTTTAGPPILNWGFTKQDSVSAIFNLYVNGSISATTAVTDLDNTVTLGDGDYFSAQILTDITTLSQITIEDRTDPNPANWSTVAAWFRTGGELVTDDYYMYSGRVYYLTASSFT
jgi:hypothetical protein